MFYLGQKFGKELPLELVEYCQLNGCVLEPFGLEGWQLTQSDEAKVHNDKERVRSIIREELQETDWRALREYDKFMEDPACEIGKTIFAYRRYLREFDKQPGEWWKGIVLDFDLFAEQ
jgi:hypothetical protein